MHDSFSIMKQNDDVEEILVGHAISASLENTSDDLLMISTTQ